MGDYKLHKIWWLWIPVFVAAAQAVLEIFLPSGILASLHSEDGLHELLEFLVIFSAFLVAVNTLLKMERRHRKWLAAWMGLAAFCCFYVAGEEVSWGQHFLKWSTPEYWVHINDQHETNIHNTSSWFDQKPRLVLFMGVVTGGLVIPFLSRFRNAWVPQRFEIIYPPAQLGVIAGVVLGVDILDKIDKNLESMIIFERASEIEELYLFYFVLLYLFILRRRIL